jgi:hypothetical protein
MHKFKKGTGLNELDLEKDRMLKEYEYKEKELELRRQEIEMKDRALNSEKFKIGGAHLTIMGIVIAALGTVLGSWLQGNTNQKLEKLKFESEVILKIAASDDIEQNKKNLKFLLDAGFISDKGGKITRLVKDTSFKLKVETESSRPITQGVILDERGHPIPDVEVEVKGERLIVITDSLGKFELFLPKIWEGAVLQFSKEGYEHFELRIQGRQEMIVSLKTSSSK